MSVTYGFYNSLNGDRKYNATQMSSLFDGIIIDGVFASIGTCLVVNATTGNNVAIGIGKAWFNHTWTLNDSILPMEAPISEVLLDRIDALVLEIDASESVRANSFKFIQGVPASTPVNPTLATGPNIYQHPLCYIYRAAESSEITQANITNMIGTETTPFVTGPLQTINLSALLTQWEAEFDQMMDDDETEFDLWFTQMKADLTTEQALLDEWITSEQVDFTSWFNQMKDQLSTDAAGNLQLEINDIVDGTTAVGHAATADFSTNGIFSYEMTVSEDVVTLVSEVESSESEKSFKFKASANKTITSVVFDDTEMTIVNGDDTEIEVVEGQWYSGMADKSTNTVHFVSGGSVKLSAATNSTLGVNDKVAATPSAVKSAHDLANTAKTTATAAMPKTGGTFTGNVMAQTTLHSARGLYNCDIMAAGEGNVRVSTGTIVFRRK